MVADRLLGVLAALLSPGLAYSSADTFVEAIPGLIRDAALVTLYFHFLFRLMEARRHRSAELPAPAETDP
jgi:hypothetical protein